MDLLFRHENTKIKELNLLLGTREHSLWHETGVYRKKARFTHIRGKPGAFTDAANPAVPVRKAAGADLAYYKGSFPRHCEQSKILRKAIRINTRKLRSDCSYRTAHTVPLIDGSL